MLSEELKSIDELIMLKHFLETEEKYEGQEREVKAIETVLNLIAKLQKENKEKDKQIDLMAKYIDEIDISEDICEGKTICDENCKNCIKQYFETKAKKGE